MKCFPKNLPFKIACLFALFLSLLFACQRDAAGEKNTMAEVIAKVRREITSPQNGFCAEAKLAGCDSVLRITTDLSQQVNLKFLRGMFLLEYGDEARAVAQYEELGQLLGQMEPKEANALLLTLGLAYMRLAERNNCVAGHASESCIMPIQGNGVHSDKIPARRATMAFERVLASDPQNYDAIWLLNVAYMTLGEYPSHVPKQWLIPGLDKVDCPARPFYDIAPDLNLAVNNRSGGVDVEDFDNDGDLDIATSAWMLDDPMHYFQNNGDGTFADRSRESGLAEVVGGLNMVSADYNNDGFVDIFLLRGAWQGQIGFGNQPNSLLRNNGNGTFSDVTIEAGMLSLHPTQTATWNDFNHDGWLDLFIGNETSSPQDAHPCEFYLNNQDGTFTNVARETGMNFTAFVKGVSSGDYDNDGWADIVVSTLAGGGRILFHNKGAAGRLPQFENVTQKAGLGDDKSPTFPTWFFDYDNDGWLDVFACNYEFTHPLSFYTAKEALHPSGDMAGKPMLYHNNHDGTFTNVTAKMGLNQTAFAMGANYGDIDNDGFLDFYLSTGNPNYMSLIPNKLFKNLGGKKFGDATVATRVGNLQKGHAVSFADLDNDGDQDIFAEMGGAYRGDAYPASLYLNPGQPQNNWICLKLEGTRANRAAIGAKIVVRFQENGHERIVCREVNTGGSFGCSPLRREIGIGAATAIDEIDITWPTTGQRQVLKNVPPNQFIRVREGTDGFEPMAAKTLVFKKADGSVPMCAPLK